MPWEAGFPGLANQTTIGPVAPAGTPAAIIEQIAQAVRTALVEPDCRQQLIDSGFEASQDTTPEKFRRRLEADVRLVTAPLSSLACVRGVARMQQHCHAPFAGL